MFRGLQEKLGSCSAASVVDGIQVIQSINKYFGRNISPGLGSKNYSDAWAIRRISLGLDTWIGEFKLRDRGWGTPLKCYPVAGSLAF
jgi:hypothetical protein